MGTVLELGEGLRLEQGAWTLTWLQTQRNWLSHLPGASFSDLPGEGLLVTHWLEEVGGLSVRGLLEGAGWGGKLEVDPPATSHPLTANLSKHEFLFMYLFTWPQ